jgi:hypothetical protein
MAIPLGIVVNLFVHLLASILTNDLPYDEKFQRSLIIIFIFGLLSLTIALTLFRTSKQFKNSVMQYGLGFGGTMMLFYSTFANWAKMEDWTKLIVISTIVFGMIWYIYKYYGKDRTSEEEKLKKLIKKLKKAQKEQSEELKRLKQPTDTDSDLLG